jgi:transcriptional regulator with GAF, ATPase, and Fis domain
MQSARGSGLFHMGSVAAESEGGVSLGMNRQPRVAHLYKQLLQVNRVALTKCTTEGVFYGMCRILKRVVPYERAGLSLYDPDHDGLKIVAIYGPHEGSIFRVGHLLNRRTTQTGWVFEHKTRLFRRDLGKELRFPADQNIMDEGYHCLCSVPLIVHGNSIAVFTVLAPRRNQLSLDHADIVEEMSNQIALAISAMIPRCPAHKYTKLVCPRCIGAAGGKATVSRYRQALSSWGKRGGQGARAYISVE